MSVEDSSEKQKTPREIDKRVTTFFSDPNIARKAPIPGLSEEQSTLQGSTEEEKKDEHTDGDFLVVPKDKIADRDGFMDALFAFQYGTGEESDEGFEKMTEIASPQKQEKQNPQDTKNTKE